MSPLYIREPHGPTALGIWCEHGTVWVLVVALWADDPLPLHQPPNPNLKSSTAVKENKVGQSDSKAYCADLQSPSRSPSLMNVEDPAFTTVLYQLWVSWTGKVAYSDHISWNPPGLMYISYFHVSYPKTPSKRRKCSRTYYALDQDEFKKFFFEVKEFNTYKYHHEILNI